MKTLKSDEIIKIIREYKTTRNIEEIAVRTGYPVEVVMHYLVVNRLLPREGKPLRTISNSYSPDEYINALSAYELAEHSPWKAQELTGMSHTGIKNLWKRNGLKIERLKSKKRPGYRGIDWHHSSFYR